MAASFPVVLINLTTTKSTNYNCAVSINEISLAAKLSTKLNTYAQTTTIHNRNYKKMYYDVSKVNFNLLSVIC